MSIIADIKQAKHEYEQHVATHKCRARSAAIAAGEAPCDERVELIQAWFGTAGMWGREHDDHQRQLDHYNRNLRPAAAL